MNCECCGGRGWVYDEGTKEDEVCRCCCEGCTTCGGAGFLHDDCGREVSCKKCKGLGVIPQVATMDAVAKSLFGVSTGLTDTDEFDDVL